MHAPDEQPEQDEQSEPAVAPETLADLDVDETQSEDVQGGAYKTQYCMGGGGGNPVI